MKTIIEITDSVFDEFNLKWNAKMFNVARFSIKQRNEDFIKFLNEIENSKCEKYLILQKIRDFKKELENED